LPALDTPEVSGREVVMRPLILRLIWGNVD
jgi:hypothetical protein